MFDQSEFANILQKINLTYDTMSDFGKRANFDRTYISKYINKKIKNPPSPKILKKISEASNGITTYNELMFLCGYTNNYQINEYYLKRENSFYKSFYKLKEIGLTDDEMEKLKDICLSNTRNNNSNILISEFVSTLPKKIQKDVIDFYNSFLEETYSSFKPTDQNININHIQSYNNTFENKQVYPLLGMVKAGYDYLSNENIIGYVAVDKKVPDVENCYALQIVGDSMQPILYEDDIIIVHKQNDVESGQVAIVLIDNEEATVKKVIKHKDYIELIAFNSYYPPKKLTNKDNFSIIGKVIEGRITKIFE